MKMPTRIVTIGLVAVTAVVALAGFGGHGRFSHHDPARMTRFANLKIDDTLDDLKASDLQRRAIHSSTDRLLQSGFALAQSHEATHAELLTQWNAATPDTAKLHALVDARIDSFRGFAHTAVDELVRIHDTLTPAQRTELSDRFKD